MFADPTRGAVVRQPPPPPYIDTPALDFDRFHVLVYRQKTTSRWSIFPLSACIAVLRHGSRYLSLSLSLAPPDAPLLSPPGAPCLSVSVSLSLFYLLFRERAILRGPHVHAFPRANGGFDPLLQGSRGQAQPEVAEHRPVSGNGVSCRLCCGTAVKPICVLYFLQVGFIYDHTSIYTRFILWTLY